MRIGKGLKIKIFFTAWEYKVTYLELASVITSLIAVWLGARGTRRAWPWWILSSALYGVFFYFSTYYASAILQIIFIAAAIWGWFGWKPTGVEPRYMRNKERSIWFISLILIWVITAPLLANIGAAASWPDSFLLISSAITQVVMVLQRNETWVLWFVIDAFGTWHYARQELYFTSILYAVFTAIALYGWVRWLQLRK